MDPDEYALSEYHLHTSSVPVESNTCDATRPVLLTELRFRVPLTELTSADFISECAASTDWKSLDHDRWEYTLPVYHAGPTHLHDVGSQLWNASLLLIDWLIDLTRSNASFQKDDVILELGAGLGCPSVIAALCGAGTVFITDRWHSSSGCQLTELCDLNVNRWKVRFNLDDERLRMRHCDWTEGWPPKTICHEEEGFQVERKHANYFWRLNELAIFGSASTSGAISSKLRLLLIADAIYETDLTEALLRTVCAILEANPSSCDRMPLALFAIERRVCFSITEMQSVALAYDHFVDCLNQLNGYCPAPHEGALQYSAQQIATLDIPQYIIYPDGSRDSNLHLWSLQLVPCNTSNTICLFCSIGLAAVPYNGGGFSMLVINVNTNFYYSPDVSNIIKLVQFHYCLFLHYFKIWVLRKRLVGLWEDNVTLEITVIHCSEQARLISFIQVLRVQLAMARFVDIIQRESWQNALVSPVIILAFLAMFLV